jgi:hypothetical protein
VVQLDPRALGFIFVAGLRRSYSNPPSHGNLTQVEVEVEVEVEVTLRPTFNLPFRLVVGHPFIAYDQILIFLCLTIAFFLLHIGRTL